MYYIQTVYTTGAQRDDAKFLKVVLWQDWAPSMHMALRLLGSNGWSALALHVAMLSQALTKIQERPCSWRSICWGTFGCVCVCVFRLACCL